MEYYNNGNIKFEGKYFNGIPLSGKIYNENRNLISQTQINNGTIKRFSFSGFLIFRG